MPHLFNRNDMYTENKTDEEPNLMSQVTDRAFLNCVALRM
jgi:hypothetical protein